MKIIAIYSVLVGSLLVMTACEDKGTLERAGERADEVIDNAKDGDPLLHKKGTMEKAGEAVDESVKDLKNKETVE